MPSSTKKNTKKKKLGQSTTACPTWWDFETNPPTMLYPTSPGSLDELPKGQLRDVWETHPDLSYAMQARDELFRRSE
jgi:hypothetical protein